MDKKTELGSLTGSPSQKPIDHDRHRWDVYDKSQATLPSSNDAGTSSEQKQERKLFPQKDIQSDKTKANQLSLQDRETQFIQQETVYNQKTQEIHNLLQGQRLDNTLLQNMQSSDRQDLHAKIEEHTQEVSKMISIASEIYARKMQILQDIRKNISSSQEELTEINSNISLLPHQERLERESILRCYTQLDSISRQKQSYISDPLQQVFLSGDEKSINGQINRLKQKIKERPDLLNKRKEEKNTLLLEINQHKSKIEEEIKSLYQKVEVYNKATEEWIKQKETIETYLLNHNEIYKTITSEDIDMENVNTSSEEAESIASTDSQSSLGTGEKMWDIITSAQSGECPYPTELRLPDQKENITDMIARHLAFSFFNNPEKKPVEIAKIVTTKGKEVPVFSAPSLPVTSAQENEYLETIQKILGDKNKIRRVGPESDYYNCHGLTFAQRRGHIIDEDIKILLEDYEFVVKSDDPFLPSKLQQIPLGDAIPPIVVYPNGEHSAPISRIENGKIYCIGTDGPYGEYELEINDFPTIYGDKDESWRIYKWPDQQRVPLIIPTGEQTDLQSSQQISDIPYPNKGKDRA